MLLGSLQGGMLMLLMGWLSGGSIVMKGFIDVTEDSDKLEGCVDEG